MSTFVGVLDFNAAIDKAVFANLEVVRRIFIRTALMMFGSVVVGDPPYSPGTPVGDPTYWKHRPPPGYVGGFARANWYAFVVSEGDAPEAVTNAEAAPGYDPRADAVIAVSGFQLGQTVWLVNHAPYIVALEFGHSIRQAPAGMVRLTLAAAQEIVDEAMIIEQSRAAA